MIGWLVRKSTRIIPTTLFCLLLDWRSSSEAMVVGDSPERLNDLMVNWIYFTTRSLSKLGKVLFLCTTTSGQSLPSATAVVVFVVVVWSRSRQVYCNSLEFRVN